MPTLTDNTWLHNECACQDTAGRCTPDLLFVSVAPQLQHTYCYPCNNSNLHDLLLKQHLSALKILSNSKPVP